MSTPRPGIDKGESRRIRQQIRKVFLEVWDPIGVVDEPNAQDEYDAYIGPVYELLERSATDEEFVDYLLYVVYERMGLGETKASVRAHQKQVVAALREIPLSPV